MARILVIDDDEVSRIATGAAIEAQGHEVGYAADGEIGITLYGRSPYDVVIVDLAMPKMNGVLVIKELRKIDPAARIIAVSGVAPEQLELAQQAGALGSLTKPVDPTQLQQMLDGALRRSMGWEGVSD
jgi:CheY-like chemotaxis protein